MNENTPDDRSRIGQKLFAALLLVAGILAIITAASATWVSTRRGQSLRDHETLLKPHLPAPSNAKGYISSNQCRACHPTEHASWHRTFHRTMTQSASPENVLGAFDGSSIESDGLQFRVSREGDEFWAEMPDPDVMMYIFQGKRKLAPDKVPRVRQRVVMTTGSHHYQTYWVASPRYSRLLQTLPLVYLIEDQRWVPREAAFMRGPDDPERFITQWNHHCIRCHSTGGNPGLNDATGMLDTTVGELGISCEACHGPAAEHVAFHRNPVNRYQRHLSEKPDGQIVNPLKLDHRKSSEACGQCHGVYLERDEYAMTYAHEGILFKPGDDLHKTRYYIQHPATSRSPERMEDLRRNPSFFQERWWEDGTILAGGREYTALAVSACFTRGEISCLSCHSMHESDPNDQLKVFPHETEQCTQCHQEPRFTTDVRQHTFHAPGSSGSNCLNCHMPHTTYALFKGIRSHQITSPQIESSARFGVPNACNLCHLDKTLGWTQESLAQWYGKPVQTLSPEQAETSAALLWLLKGHAAQRVVAAWHFGWIPAQEVSGAGWLAPFVAQLLEDPYGVVRYVAARSLRSLPEFKSFTYDFLASAPDLAARKQAAMELWEKAPLASKGTHSQDSILLSTNGGIRHLELLRLLQQRDNRPVRIKE